MAVAPGDRVGPYEIVSALGVGGMGEVYRATDTVLKRQVALKLLPPDVAGNPERVARFQREAEVLASLNHPNVAHLYGVEKSNSALALVMELVEGETLADRIARGPIPVDESVAIAKQIAEALEAAHEQGIVHRDLKPANIKVREDGAVKVLDFGLAKALEPSLESGPVAVLTNSPTLTSAALTTGAGVLLGTAAYMAPEQVKGRPADKRSDVWSFGCVLFEMLTGTRAIVGNDVAETVASTLAREPDWRLLPPGISERLLEALRGCLQKDRAARIPQINIIRYILNCTGHPQVQTRARLRPRTAGAAAAVGLLVGLAVVAFRSTADTTRFTRLTRFDIALPLDQVVAGGGRRRIAISPDGQYVAYIASRRVYLKRIDAPDAMPLRGTDGEPEDVFFSPDSKWVAFFQSSISQNSGTLVKVPIAGGEPVPLSPLPALFGASWGSDGFIYVGRDVDGIWRIPETGGSWQQVVKSAAGHRAYGPQLLPGGRRVLYTSVDTAFASNQGAGQWSAAQVMISEIGSEHSRLLVDHATDGRLVGDEWLLFGRQEAVGRGRLFAVRFDAGSATLRGDPILLVPSIAAPTPGNPGGFQFAASNDLLAYRAPDLTRRVVTWVTRTGEEQPMPLRIQPYAYAVLSPDSSRIALDIRDEQSDIWIFRLPSGPLTRLTTEPSVEVTPVWAPDGRSVFFASDNQAKQLNVFRMATDGTGTWQQVIKSEFQTSPQSVTPDGRQLVYRQIPDGTVAGANDIHLLDLLSNESRPLLTGKSDEHGARISPDGRWLAYHSNETGQVEVFVRPFPDIRAGKWQITSGGGTHPVWNPRGGELFYMTPSGAITSVSYGAGRSFEIRGQREILHGPFYVGTNSATYDVTSDGQRFLVIKAAPPEAQRFSVVQNWSSLLK